MAWFYEIRDSNKAVAETGKGFIRKVRIAWGY